MPTLTRFSLTCLAALCVSGSAFAEPPKLDPEADILIEKLEDKLADHSVDIAKSSSRLQRKLERGKANADGDVEKEIGVMMDVMEEAFSEDGFFRDLAAMFGDIAKDLDVDTDNGKTTLSFDGAKIAQIEQESSRDSEDRVSISGLGRSLTMDRETIVKNGKSKTRIVIEMDGDDEIEIVLPDMD